MSVTRTMFSKRAIAFIDRNVDDLGTLLAGISPHVESILLSDVDGIYLREGEPDTKLSRLTAEEAETMINNGTATGGMIPKLQSITALLRRGVHSTHILSGTSRNALLTEIFTDRGTGTMIVP